MSKFSDYVKLFLPRRAARWSIGIYAGSSPFSLAPHPMAPSQPVLGPDSLGKIKATGVADPFMLRQGDSWLMFFEVENRISGRGEIGLATSRDMLAWQFQGIVLKEPFHLSYPVVWESDGTYYMMPEAAASGAVRLYEAQSFPMSWKLRNEPVRGNLADATPFFHGGRWWIFALDGFRGRDAMMIYFADRLDGPWKAHAQNPIYQGNRALARAAGRVIDYQGQLYRFAQDYESHYGRLVRAFRIDELTPHSFAESAVGGGAVLGATGSGWNASGMHHIDAHEVAAGQWVACVDGRRNRLDWPALDRARARLYRLPDAVRDAAGS